MPPNSYELYTERERDDQDAIRPLQTPSSTGHTVLD